MVEECIKAFERNFLQFVCFEHEPTEVFYQWVWKLHSFDVVKIQFERNDAKEIGFFVVDLLAVGVAAAQSDL